MNMKALCLAFAMAFSSGAMAKGKINEKVTNLKICADYGSHTTCKGERYQTRRDDGRNVTYHEGVDFEAPPGTKVFSVANGKVRAIGYYKCGGGVVSLDADIDHNGKPLIVRHFHLAALNEAIKAGDTIEQGTYLGEVQPLDADDTCYGGHTHVHVDTLESVKPRVHLDPNAYWANGEINCIKKAGAMIAPLECAYKE